ncbi:ABC transporter ATP-binding protein [Kitasatospora sp. DSM 101779]|uniref:ABC transporter ATP-binding protein n=1 Tax=Kitasatospora sp. DSM 101779 TaxID=2853165 RepID=UPI0021D8E2B7
MRPHRAGASLACSLLVVSGAVALAQPLVVRDLLSAFAVGRDWQRQAWELVGLVLLDAVVVAFGNYLLMRAAEGVVLHARRALVAHVLRLPMVEVHRQTPGDLMARVAGDTMLLRQVVTQTLVQALTGFVTVIGTLIMMGIVDPTLLVVTLGVLLLLGLVVGVLMPRIRRAALSAQDAVGSMGAALERALTSFTTVKASGTEELEAGRVGDSAKAAYNQGISLAWSTSVAGTSAGLAMQVAFLTVLGVGGARVADGAISLATLIAFLLYVMYLAQPVLSLVNVGTYFQAARAALQRIAEVQRLPVEPLDEPETDSPAVAPRRAAASVRFDNVTFTYPGRKDPAVDSFSLTVPARGLTAMVGPSGAGKTTLLSLVERFWDPDRGRVLLDGTDLRQWNLRDLRAGIGYVEQDAPVIAGTLRENLTYTAPAADEALLWEVLRTTRLEALVERLDGDLDAPLPRGGASLSGGERQRIAIARALLRRPRLLILDEATSQLDAVNEAALREAVDEVARTTTVLVVAHRLSTVLSADLIAVVDQGGLRAVGRHAELLRHDVLYAELAANQLVG